MEKFKNIDEIKDSTRQVRGEVISQDDLDLIWITGQNAQYIDETGKPYIIEKFDETQRNTIELTVYDMDENQLFWSILPGAIRSYSSVQPNTVVLSPGDDLRVVGFTRGQYRVVYEFYRDILGSFTGSKLYVDDISPSRNELRARPVKVANAGQNTIFNTEVEDFSDNGIPRDDYTEGIQLGIAPLTRDNIFQDKTSMGYNLLTDDKLQQLKEVTVRVIAEKTALYDKDILIVGDQQRINAASLFPIMDEIFSNDILPIFVGLSHVNFKWYMNPGAVQIAIEWFRILNSLAFVDNYSGNIDYYINFGNGETYSVTNWLRDDTSYPDTPYSIVFKLYEPLPRDVKEKEQFWVSRQITRPVIEKVFMLGLEQPFENGVVLRPANFDVNLGGSTGRETGFQTWNELISTQPSTSQDILDHFMSASDAGDIELNIDYSDYANFINFGSATERLENFKYKLELIDTYNANIGKLNTYYTDTASLSVSFDTIESGSQYVLRTDRTYTFVASNPLLADTGSLLYFLSGSTVNESIETLVTKINDTGSNTISASFYDETLLLYANTGGTRGNNFSLATGSLTTLQYFTGGRSNVYVSQSSDGFRTKIRQVKNGFDSYERHLYYVSGSQYSGSLISNDTYLTNKINEWPKQNKQHPYVLYNTTSSVATNWYADQLAITQRFDTDNINSFRNNLPSYITTDPNNEDYLDFMYMVGQHFDTIFTYIKQLTLTANRDESLYEGLAKDLTYNVASSFGFDLFNGNDNSELWRWAFGYDQYGTYHTGSISGSAEDHLPYSDVSKEIWRRLLNNMPYIMKTKGTARSVKALLSCYGIPTSLLTIREFGGPDPRDYDDIGDKSAYIFEDFVYAIDFEASQSVNSTWGVLSGSNNPRTIEFRFASAPTYNNPSSSVGLGDAKPTQSLVNTDNWSINLINEGSGFGHIQFAINDGSPGQEWSIQTETYRYYDNEFNSVMLRISSSFSQSTIETSSFSNIELWTKKAESDRIIYYSSASLSASVEISNSFNLSSTLYIGGDDVPTFGQQFTGSMQEFKMYNTMLTEDTWDNHVRWPKSYNTNNSEATYYDLVLRYSFDEPKNHSSDTVVSDVKANQTYTNPGTANNFDNWVNYTPRTEEFAALSPNIGGGRFINNKIRIESNELISDLSPRKRVELGAYDRSPNDSPKLGIYFSPLDSVNKDIIATYAGIDLLDKIGDPRSRFDDEYGDLKELQYNYWKKYTDRPQFNDYIRVIKQFDQSFFNQLKALIPARAKPIIGVLVESNILERYKVKWYPVEKERNDYEGNSINQTSYLTQSMDKYDFDANIKLTYSSASEYILYEGEYDLGYRNTASYYEGEQQVIPMVEPIEESQTGSYDIRRVYNRISSSVDDGAIKYERVASWTDGGEKKYSNFYDVWDLKEGNWLWEYRELQYGLWYGGTLNTIETTVDGKPPVEITYTNPNKLKATDTGPSKIIVD